MDALYCKDAKKDFGIDVECCNSCHEDDDEDFYNLLECYVNNKTYFVCCAVMVEINKRKDK